MRLSINATKDLARIRQSSSVRNSLNLGLVHGRKVAEEMVLRHPARVREVICTSDRVSDWRDLFRSKIAQNNTQWPGLKFGTPNQLGTVSGVRWSTEPSVIMDLPEVEQGESLLPSRGSQLDTLKPWIQRVVVMDGISDPGNLGTLIRTAEAFGWDSVFVVKEPGFASCDLWNEKSIRAGRGAHFGIPHFGMGTARELIQWLEQRTLVRQLYVGSLSEDAEIFPPELRSMGDPVAIALGNEHSGGTLSQLLDASKDSGEEESSSQAIRITGLRVPIRSESLNVSCTGSILMHHFARPLED